MKTINRLTDAQIRSAKPQEKSYKLQDGDNLYVEVTPTGCKTFYYRIKLPGLDSRITLGQYPGMSLAEAREGRDEKRKKVQQGINPTIERKVAKRSGTEAGANTVEAVTREFLAMRSKKWSEGHAQKVREMFERDVFPFIGSISIGQIDAPTLLVMLRRVEKRAGYSSHRVRSKCGEVMRYAVATGRALRDPTYDLKGALASVRGGHFAALTDKKDYPRLGEILCAIDNYQGHVPTKIALCIQPYVFVRPIELRHMRWEDLDFESKEWRYTATKTNTQHIVPLATQVIALLEEIRPLTGRGVYVFQGNRGKNRPITDNALSPALRRMGIDTQREQSVHGFRSTARTILEEALGYAPHIIEQQLAHVVRDPLGRAYNRTTHLDVRREMMQAWADWLDGLKAHAALKAAA